METLTCAGCDRTWERERVRGRKPKLCPGCKGVKTPTSSGADAPPPPPKPRKKKPSKWAALRDDTAADPILEALPPASRTSGWCTDYDPAPAAQHEKCDGNLGKWRCPCDCHGVK